ncbi:hypothetical protein M1O57_03085 [Dehalococcoidia bacterium]|nr:hypothetical protein [Dehalococcoidia bacterium]MCL0103723.1 hypothetical protein [Dehalococcoidia bacterium]MCL0104559.1 hypothetical protein [Dehalococcoidia bacterium]
MRHHILVLHFGAQCPWHLWVIEQAKQAAQKLNAEVAIRNVMDHPELAEKQKMFFPFMTIIDRKIRLSGPMRAEELIRIAKEGPERKPVLPIAHGERTEPHLIRELTPENVKTTIPLCIAGVRPIADREKALWLQEMLNRSGCSLLGFIGFRGKEAKGVVEYLPSNLVPYPLPCKNPSIAFITCIYPTEPDIDCKSQVLERLVDYLRGENYKELQVVAGERTPYPNGPVVFFKRHGFVELEEIDLVGLGEAGEEKLILMHKRL